jgi:hypothetical protein
VPDRGVEGQQPLDDPGPQPGGDASAVAFEAELALQWPDDDLDALPQPVRERTQGDRGRSRDPEGKLGPAP